jgi:hypothetical protein
VGDEFEPLHTAVSLTLVTNDQWYPKTKEMTKWRIAYPGVDVEQEIRAMDAWGESNKSKRWTRGGVSRAVNTWLREQQDRASKIIRPNSFTSSGKPEPKHPAASISGDLYRHAIALDQIIEEKLTGRPAEPSRGTFKFDLNGSADRIIAAVREQLGDEASDHAIRSMSFGTARVALLKKWDMVTTKGAR